MISSDGENNQNLPSDSEQSDSNNLKQSDSPPTVADDKLNITRKRKRPRTAKSTSSPADSPTLPSPTIVDYRSILADYPDLPESSSADQIFKDSNALSPNDCRMILNFLCGRPIPQQEHSIKDILLNRNIRPDPSDASKQLVEQIIFQINTNSGEWRKLKRTAKRSIK